MEEVAGLDRVRGRSDLICYLSIRTFGQTFMTKTDAFAPLARIRTKELQRELSTLHSTEEIIDDMSNWKSPPGGFFAVPAEGKLDEEGKDGEEEMGEGAGDGQKQ